MDLKIPINSNYFVFISVNVHQIRWKSVSSGLNHLKFKHKKCFAFNRHFDRFYNLVCRIVIYFKLSNPKMLVLKHFI